MEEKNKNKLAESGSKLMPLSEAAKLTGYTPEYLNSCCRKGQLRAEKIGRNWHTTLAEVNEFLSNIPGKKKIELPEELSEAKTSDGEVASSWEDFEEEEGGNESGKKEDKPLTLENEKTSFDKKKISVGIFSVVILMPIIFALMTFTNLAAQKINEGNLGSADKKFFDEIKGDYIVNENEILKGEVLAEEDSNEEVLEKSSGIVLASENYKARELSVGGATVILASAENLPLEITDVRSESFVSGKKEEVKVVVSWRTNKPAVSEINYSKNNGQNSKIISEDSFGFTHSVVLSGLEGRTSYVYSIKCRDKWGAEKNSDYFGIYTASKPVSVFDMIAKAFGDAFGWAVRK